MTTHVGNEVFEPVSETGWRRGFGNLWQGEFSSWFKSSRWLKQLLMWVLIVNGMMVIMGFATQGEGEGAPDFLFMYGIFGSMFVAFGVMIIMQRAIVGEKKDGTAAWLLSKPVTHTAFIVSRLAGNSLVNPYSRCACLRHSWVINRFGLAATAGFPCWSVGICTARVFLADADLDDGNVF